MDERSLNSRLSRISTIWSMLDDRETSSRAAEDPRLALIERYQGAAYRYLLGAVRDPDVADDLFQEFALRAMRGAFGRADRHRGRFRDYLKTALIHLVIDHQRGPRRRTQPLDNVATPAGPEGDPGEFDRQFRESWRDELLARAWNRLEEAERQGGQPYYSVLRFRVDQPTASSAEMAARLTEQLRPQRPFTETGVRKTLQRAREQFAEAMIDEVAASLGEHALEELEQELIDLDLLSYCRSALAKRLAARGRDSEPRTP